MKDDVPTAEEVQRAGFMGSCRIVRVNGWEVVRFELDVSIIAGSTDPDRASEFIKDVGALMHKHTGTSAIDGMSLDKFMEYIDHLRALNAQQRLTIKHNE